MKQEHVEILIPLPLLTTERKHIAPVRFFCD